MIIKLFLCILLYSSGCDAAVLFASVQDAIAQLPQLSLLNQQLHSQLKNISLFNCLQEGTFAGTVFAPVNAGLKPFQVIGDLTTVFGDQHHVADIFSTAVVPGQHLTLDQMQHGVKLGTLNGHTVTVSVIKTKMGAVYYANKAQITTANIAAGKAIVHLVSPMVAAPEHQDVVDALIGLAQPISTPTVLWQDLLAAQEAAVSTSAGPAQTAGQASSSPASTPGTMAVPIGMQGPIGVSESGSSVTDSAWEALPSMSAHDDEEDTVVNYSYEQDFAEQSPSSSTGGGGLNMAAVMAQAAQLSTSPPAAGRSSALAPEVCLQSMYGLLQFLLLPLLLAAVL